MTVALLSPSLSAQSLPLFSLTTQRTHTHTHTHTHTDSYPRVPFLPASAFPQVAGGEMATSEVSLTVQYT